MLVGSTRGSVSTVALASPARQTSRSPERITQAVALIGAVRGALRSGLIEALWRWQPCTVEELAVRAHLVPRAVDLTLHALASGGVVAEFDGQWTMQAPPGAWAGLVDFDEHICNFVETGAPTGADGDDRYAGVLSVIGRFHEPVAAQLAPALVHPHARILELGAGTAPWARALLACEPTATAVVVDLPSVAAGLEREIASGVLASRITCRAGDVRDLTLAGRFDVIVIAGLCRLLSDDDNAQLFVRCGGWLATDGCLVVCDALADSADPDGALALYALGLAARSHAEALWATADYDRWLQRAGLVRSSVVATDRPEVTVMLCKNPNDEKDHSA
jgi:SAM-dependent methyltransferase